MTPEQLAALEPAPLDAAIGLGFAGVEGATVVLRLDPAETAVVDDEGGAYLHGGTLATVVDTAGWHAVVLGRDGDWVAVDLRVDFVRPARRHAHRVEARCLRAGRTLALADVTIAPWDEPSRLVAAGRAQFARVAG